jgi:hypothetical protein
MVLRVSPGEECRKRPMVRGVNLKAALEYLLEVRRLEM